jgi:hypothetical protein
MPISLRGEKQLDIPLDISSHIFQARSLKEGALEISHSTA